MSIHAKLSTEAEAKLRSQQRKSTISAVIISILVFALIFVALAFVLLQTIGKKSSEMISFATASSEEVDIKQPEIVNQVEKKPPAAPSSATSRVIASSAMSNFAIPVPQTEITEPSIEFGDGNDFGDGWGEGVGTGAGGGGGMFGSAGGSQNRLQGYIYDLTQQSNGRPSKYASRYKESDNCPWQDPFVSELVRGGMRDSLLSKYYRGPQKLGVNQILIPCSLDATAPKAFGAEGKMKSGAWVIVYRGKVRAPVSGKIRFCGTADNYIGVQLDRKRVLFYGTGGHQTLPLSPAHPVPGLRLAVAFGDWINVREGQWYDMDVVIGDAGGLFSAILYYEKEGEPGKKYLFRTEDASYDDVMNLDGKATGGVRDLPRDLEANSPVWECKGR